eukprot:7793964-Heterocapsa_arctica.AAC.1
MHKQRQFSSLKEEAGRVASGTGEASGRTGRGGGITPVPRTGVAGRAGGCSGVGRSGKAGRPGGSRKG